MAHKPPAPKPVRKRSFLFGPEQTPDEHERSTAVLVGGRKTKASGAMVHDKGDVIASRLLIENKQTDGNVSLSVKAEWLVKISREAFLKHRDPVLAIKIVGLQDPACEREWMMMPKSVFARMIRHVDGDE